MSGGVFAGDDRRERRFWSPEFESMGSETAPDIAVIIPTRNRTQDLTTAVQSVFGQTVIPGILMIVDQSPGTDSKQSIEQAYSEAPLQIRENLSLRYIHDPRISGLAEARNRGMDALEGGIWLFLDDDVILEPRFIEEILAAYEWCPKASGISGIVTNYARPSRAFRFWSRLFMRGPFFDDRQPVYWQAERLRGHDPCRVCRLGGGLMSFRAEAVRNVRFDERLRGVSDGEDIDFCMRLGPGAPLFIAPRARLIHNQSAAGREQRHWLARTSRAAFYLYRQHWKHGLKNRLCFCWFNVGCALLASAGALRKRSLGAWRAFLTGVRDARKAAES